MLAPAPGEHVLDIGTGPGLLAYDLARMVGERGRLVGLRRRAVDAGEWRARGLRRCRRRNAWRAMPPISRFRMPRFDIAVSTQVHEYVADMEKAVKGLHRVLKPGGRALVLDTDWRSGIVWHSSDKARMERVLHCWDDHLADPHLPATLGARMRRAGFRVPARRNQCRCCRRDGSRFPTRRAS